MLVELYFNNKKLLNQFFDSFSFCINEEQLKNEFQNNPYVHYLLYMMNDKVVGYLNYSIIYDRIEINQIYVLDDMRKKGIASSMMHYLIDLSNKENIKNITLEVKCNNTKAINLYQKFGFIKKAIRPKYYNGTDGILMEKEMIK